MTMTLRFPKTLSLFCQPVWRRISDNFTDTKHDKPERYVDCGVPTHWHHDGPGHGLVVHQVPKERTQAPSHCHKPSSFTGTVNGTIPATPEEAKEDD